MVEGAHPTLVPVRERLAGVQVPTVDRGEIGRRWGSWNPGLCPGPRVSEQARSVAQVVAGVRKTTLMGGWGTSRYAWQQAVQELGLDPANGPRGNPTVWSVRLEFG